MISFWKISFFVAVAAFVCAIEGVKLEQKYQWQELQFAWPSEEMKQEALRTGRYKVENNLPLGLDVWKDKLFITVPR